MDALDQFKDLVLRRLTVAAFWSDGQGTHGELRHVGLKPSEPLFSPVPGSRFKRI